MAEVGCKHCCKTAEALDRAPLPGEAGQLVLAHTCRECWQAWLREQVKLINELQLSPAEPAHYELLVARMKDHLRL